MDKYQGQGSKYNKKGGLIYKGEFKDDKYHGLGSTFFDSGDIKGSGIWIKGDFTGRSVSD